MKKLMVCLLALTFVVGVSAFAQQDTTSKQSSDQMSKSDQTSAKAPLKTLKGTVKAEGDKVVFVDKDGKSWDVMNPEELKGHEGHQVQLSAHVYADKSAIHVTSVKMMKGEKSGEPTSKY
jgi:Ni/Co efflux regulator RcnB